MEATVAESYYYNKNSTQVPHCGVSTLSQDLCGFLSHYAKQIFCFSAYFVSAKNNYAALAKAIYTIRHIPVRVAHDMYEIFYI